MLQPAAVSTDRCNTVDSARAEGGVASEIQNPDLLHGKPEGRDVGALAESGISPTDCPAV